MQYGGLFQTGNENSGGWRYGFENRPTSNAALQQVAPIDPEFLKKVAGMKPEEKKGLLDTALTAQPLQGLLDTGGAPGSEPTFGGGATGAQPGREASSQWGANQYGVNVGMNPAGAAKGFALGGLPGALLGGVSVSSDPLGKFAYQQLVAQEDRDIASMSNYGTGFNANGPTTQAQAQALADQLARELAGYQGGSISGDGGYGGFGGMTGGDGSMGFGGEY